MPQTLNSLLSGAGLSSSSTPNNGDAKEAHAGTAEEMQDHPSWQSALGSIARRARESARAATLTGPLEGLTAPLASSDLEAGEDAQDGQRASWAKHAAERVRQQAADAAGNARRLAALGVEKAKSVDWGEQVKEKVTSKVALGVERVRSVEWTEQAKELQRRVSTGFDSVSDSASSAASSAASSIQERGQVAGELARGYSENAIESLRESQVVSKVKDGASAAATAAKGTLQVAGEKVSSVAALTISPVTWAKFAAIFGVGTLFVALSLNFLPLLIIAPGKFAATFTVGSVTILSAFVVLHGPAGLLKKLLQRDRLLLSSAYVVSLIGTLWATLIMRSYIFTAIFGLMQAVSLLYFVASYLPGGKATVTACCRFGGRSVRSLIGV